MTRERTAKPFPWRCPKCLKREVRPGILGEYCARAKHDGKVHEVAVNGLRVAQCQACGEVAFTIETDEQINRALRDKLGLLQPEQIRELRAGRFTQLELADLLGTAAETISRWETGAVIQSRALDNLLRLFSTVPGVEEALRRSQAVSPGERWTGAFSPAADSATQTGMLAVLDTGCLPVFCLSGAVGVSYETSSGSSAETEYSLAA